MTKENRAAKACPERSRMGEGVVRRWTMDEGRKKNRAATVRELRMEASHQWRIPATVNIKMAWIIKKNQGGQFESNSMNNEKLSRRCQAEG